MQYSPKLFFYLLKNSQFSHFMDIIIELYLLPYVIKIPLYLLLFNLSNAAPSRRQQNSLSTSFPGCLSMIFYHIIHQVSVKSS